MDGTPHVVRFDATTLWHLDAAEWAPSTASKPVKLRASKCCPVHPGQRTCVSHGGTSESCHNVWPGRAVQDGLPRSANVRAASMYQASEVERLLLAIMGIRAHP